MAALDGQHPEYLRMLPFGRSVGPYEVFVSYAHEDELQRRALEEHLAPLSRMGHVALWHDRKLVPGTDWDSTIDDHVESAHLILLLISPAFIASDYCYGREMKRALERHADGSAVVIPVILRPCLWTELPFSKIQALPKDALAVTSWSNADEAYLSIAEGLRIAIGELRPLDIVSGDERYSPSSLVALRTNLLLRPGRLQPRMFRLVCPDLAYAEESFLVTGVWDVTGLLQPGRDIVAEVFLDGGVMMDPQRQWESTAASIHITVPRSASSVLVRSNPGVERVTVGMSVPGLDPPELSSSVFLAPFPTGDFP